MHVGIRGEHTFGDGHFPMWIDKGMNEAPKSSYYELCLQNVDCLRGETPMATELP